jgi:hypothetical protein
MQEYQNSLPGYQVALALAGVMEENVLLVHILVNSQEDLQ